jgi:hypothetical protein
MMQVEAAIPVFVETAGAHPNEVLAALLDDWAGQLATIGTSTL